MRSERRGAVLCLCFVLRAACVVSVCLVLVLLVEWPSKGQGPTNKGTYAHVFLCLFSNQKRPELASSKRDERAAYTARFIRGGLASLW